MQIDLANTLFTRPIFIFLPFTTCEAHLLPLYSLLLVRLIFYLFTLLLFIARKTNPLLFTLYCPQARNSPPSEGVGEAFGRGFRGGCLKWGGHTDKRVNHKVNFDFD